MARKRLNVKFLVLLTIPFVLLGMAYGAYHIRWVKWMVRGTPASHAAQGKMLFEQGKYEEAGEKFKRAIQLNGAPDAQWYTELGDCYAHLVYKSNLGDWENLRNAKACWDQALVVNPGYLPALASELLLFNDQADLTGGGRSAQQWDALADAAKKVLAVDPKNRDARWASNRAIIKRWASGVETDATQIDQATTALIDIANEDPFDARPLLDALSGKAYQAQEDIRQSDRAGVLATQKDLDALADKLVKDHPDSAQAHYVAGLVLRTLVVIDPKTNSPKYGDRVRAEADKAATLVKPDDAKYVEIDAFEGQVLAEKDAKSAEKLYRDVMTQSPSDLNARLALADMVARQPNRIPEAIDLLENLPPIDPTKTFGVRAIQRKQLELVALTRLVDLKLEAAPSQNDAAASAAMLKSADDYLAKLLATPGMSDAPLVLRLQGRLQLAKNQKIEAVQTLTRAMNLLPPGANQEDIENRFQIMMLLARADLATDQTGDAKSLLTQVVTEAPGYIPARLMLVQTLMRENNIEDARKHLDVLNKAAPDSPVVQRLYILSLNPQKDQAEIESRYQKLPETSAEEILGKEQIATMINKRDDAIRLLEGYRAKNPGDVNMLLSLARLYAQSGAKDKALAAVNDAVQRQPEDANLRLMQAQLAGTSMADAAQQAIDRETDPFQKELMLYDRAVQQKNLDEANKHVDAAAKIKPDDTRVNTVLFNRALQNKQWDLAESLVQRLASNNADGAGGELYQIQMLTAKGDLNGANDRAQQLTSKMPEFSQSWTELARIELQQGKYSDAIIHYNTALQKQALNLEAYQGLIDASYAMKQQSQARAYIDQARKLFAGNAALREVEIKDDLTFGDASKAISAREQQLKANPDAPDAWMTMGETYLAAASRKTTPGDVKSLTEKARDTFTGAIAKWPDEAAFAQAGAGAMARLNDVDGGVKLLQSLAARPAWKDRPDASLMLSDYYTQNNRSADAEALLRQMLASSQSVAVEGRLALMLARQGKTDDALKILSANASDVSIRNLRLQIEIDARRYADAEKDVDDAIASTANPSSIFLNRKAFILMQTNRSDQASKLLDDLLSKTPGDREALLYRAEINLRAGKSLDQVVRDIQSAIRGPNDLEARKLLVAAYRARGDASAATAELEGIVAANPADKSAQLDLYNLYTQTQPPRWNDAERLLIVARSLPQYANDPDIIATQARMWLVRKDAAKATDYLNEAQKIMPQSNALINLQCEILILAKDYRQVLAVTDATAKADQAPWWIHNFRGIAKQGLGDRQGALDELTTALNIAAVNEQNNVITEIVRTIATQIGIDQAKAKIIDRANKGENRFRLLMSSLLVDQHDIHGALDWTQQVIDDPKALPADVDVAERSAALLYQQVDPPQADKSVQLYKKLLISHPDDLEILNNLACAMILPNSGSTAKEAIEYSTKAYNKLDSQGIVNPAIYDTQGYGLVLTGQVDQGITVLRQAQQKAPLPDLSYHLGVAYLSLPTPQITDAKAQLQQALQLLDAAVKAGQQGDPELKSKIELEIQRANSMAPADAAQPTTAGVSQ